MAGKTRASSGLLTVAHKEFFDHIQSRKFVLIFSIFLVIAIIGMIGGIAQISFPANRPPTVRPGLGPSRETSQRCLL